MISSKTRLLLATPLLALALATTSACSSENTDCNVVEGKCTVTFDRGVNAKAEVLGVNAEFVSATDTTATLKIGGQQIKQGDWLMLHYTAANLDPRHFVNPLEFDITRPNANKQIAFGFGIHFCLGAQLARQELRSLFTHLVPRLASAELAGGAATSKAVFVSGYKSLPLRYTLM
jgi:hypothetical protein